MKLRLNITLAAVALALASPAAAQAVDWGSEANKVWWNGVTQAELQELVIESGGTWTDIDDEGGLRQSRLDWPDLQDGGVREGEGPSPEKPRAERSCAAMLLYVAAPTPQDIDSWWLGNGGWLAFGGVDGERALYRLERHGFGTTRGRVLATLMLFRVSAVREIQSLGGSGW